MEIEGEDGSTTQLKEGSEVIFGRGNGFNPNDPTVSRRHILLQLKPPRVSFQVIGKNPIWVRAKESSGIKPYRRFERGELNDGDLFCVSSNNPVWFSVKKVDDEETEIMASSSEEEMKLGDELEASSESDLTGNVQDLDLGFESIDVSNIDPVKEFGFLVIGHEFDSYPKGRVRDVKSWNWFLEDSREASTDDEDDTNHDKGKKKALSRKRKKKNVKDEDDEEWTGESEEEEMITKSAAFSAQPKYSIRSKDLGKAKPKKDSSSKKGSAEKRRKRVDEVEEEDEEDETLGGFIVGDDDNDFEGDNVEEEGDDEEEEEFEEDEFEE